MDENEREQFRPRPNRQSENENKKDYFFRVTVAQTLLCLALIVAVFSVSKTSGETKQKLQNDFSRLMSWSILENNGADAVETIKQFLGESFELMPAYSPVLQTDETTTSTQQSAQKSETNEEAEASQNEITDETSQTESETNESQQDSSNMGGVDIELYKAADGTSFSPVATTNGIVRPVSSDNYTSYFGYRINPITNQKSFHTGLDIAAPQGAKIKAAYNGTVRKTGEDSHSGKYIFLLHDDGFETFYCHCSAVLAEEGAVIRAGETIALVGSTGWSTGPHLHFEVRKNGERLNPLGILEDDG